MNKDLDAILERHHDRPGALLPILHDVQRLFGHISEDAMRVIARGLNLTRAEVYGVVSFYHDFRLHPAPAAGIKICEAEACQARGVRKLLAELSDDDRAILRTVYCLGLCSVGPAALTADGEIQARLTAERLKQMIGSGT